MSEVTVMSRLTRLPPWITSPYVLPPPNCTAMVPTLVTTRLAAPVIVKVCVAVV